MGFRTMLGVFMVVGAVERSEMAEIESRAALQEWSDCCGEWVVSVRFSEEMYRLLEETGENVDASKSEVVRRMLVDYLKELGGAEE